MANIKISDLTAASAAADANEFEINEAGTSKKVTGAQISALVESNLGLGALATLSAVGTTQITDGSVTNAKLGADAVDGTKIADDAIDSEHIAAGAVDAEHLASDAVTATKVAGADGSAGQVLQSDGDGTMSWFTLAAGGGFSNIEVFTSPGTWTNPGTVEKVKVTVQAAGGSSKKNPANFPGNTAGSGAGGSAIEVISFPSATNVPVTIGVTNTAHAGTAGTTSFGAYCSATGGQGVTYANPSQNSPGAGGVGSGGNLNLQGQPGYSRPTAAGGGSSLLGQGGSGADKPGVNYGGGAGCSNQPSATRFAGGAGVVIVEY